MDCLQALACADFVDGVRDLDMYNCHNHEYLEAHGSKDERTTVCLYALGIIFVLTSYWDVFVSKNDVTSLMNVRRDGPAFKDACKFLNHLGVLAVRSGWF